jgi:hypothetical protein
MKSIYLTLGATLGLFVVLSSAQDQEMMRASNKLDLSFAGAPLISGDDCSFMFHEEFNAILGTCRNSEGHLIGSQIRMI